MGNYRRDWFTYPFDNLVEQHPEIVAALRRHQVKVPDQADWHVTGPFQTYVALPVPATLLRELYVDIGLSIHHIALLIGLGDMATRNPLTQAGVPLRPSRGRCPWNRRPLSRHRG